MCTSSRRLLSRLILIPRFHLLRVRVARRSLPGTLCPHRNFFSSFSAPAPETSSLTHDVLTGIGAAASSPTARRHHGASVSHCSTVPRHYVVPLALIPLVPCNGCQRIVKEQVFRGPSSKLDLTVEDATSSLS